MYISHGQTRAARYCERTHVDAGRLGKSSQQTFGCFDSAPIPGVIDGIETSEAFVELDAGLERLALALVGEMDPMIRNAVYGTARLVVGEEHAVLLGYVARGFTVAHEHEQGGRLHLVTLTYRALDCTPTLCPRFAALAPSSRARG